MDITALVYRSIVVLAIAAMGFVAWQQQWIQAGLGLREGDNAEIDGYGPIFADAKRFERELLRAKWVRELAVGDSSFGALLPQQFRISLDGSGAAAEREAWLQTPVTARLFERKRSRTAATTYLRGIQSVVDERGGHIRGISMSPSFDGYRANWISVLFENGDIPVKLDPRWRALVAKRLGEASFDLAAASWAWFQFDSAWITVGPEMTRDIVAHLEQRKKLDRKRGGLMAYIIAHEIEHSVTASDTAEERVSWMEEGIADVLAKWPGRTAEVAEALGLPYDRDARRLPFDKVQKIDGGYPPYTDAMRRILDVAGIDHRDRDAFARASDLLQGQKVAKVPDALAAHIVEFHSIAPKHTADIAEAIKSVDGRPPAVEPLEKAVSALAGSAGGH